MTELPAALAPMGAYNQFILHREKVPLSHVSGRPHDPHDPAIWLPFAEAAAMAPLYDAEIGFVFTAADPFFFLDIDKAYDGAKWSQLALQLCTDLRGCAVEISRSGTGLHIFGTAARIDHGCKNIPLGIELYTEGRYVALTGRDTAGDASLCVDGPMQALVATYFAGSRADRSGAPLSAEPVPEWSGPGDDAELIERALRASSASALMSGRATFTQLWEADADALGASYPGDSGVGYDASSADAALAQHLAFWTGKHGERIDRLFRMSGLMREKWEDREDYRLSTIGHAVSLCTNVYQQSAPAVLPEQLPEGTSGAREGFQYMSITQQLEHFAGCVYVQDAHRAFMPDGSMLRAEQFKVARGGYLFAVDNAGQKDTKNAWEAFTESQAYDFPKAHGTCFRPEEPPGAVIEEDGYKYVNTYIPIETPCTEGDVSPFLSHLAAMLPNERDRITLLSYMAAIVQHPGVKFSWAPLVQGVEGNGKSMLIDCIAFAVGSRYTHLPNVSDMAATGAKFNSWLQGNMFIGLEEIYASDKRDFIESLKALITNKRVEIQGKGADQITGDNRANFFMCSNHKDAILKTLKDRRYCVFYTAQQSAEDMVKLGWLKPNGEMTRYFPDLWAWLRGGGFAAVNYYLRNYAIADEHNPATLCQRAPVTSSTSEALSLSMGRIEQEIIEAIEEGRTGFCGGWISSSAFDRLLEDRRDEKRIPPNKRRGILQSLGYDYHPGLKDGRANSVSLVDGGKKPRLYIQQGHIHANLTGAGVILHYYTTAQEAPVAAPTQHIQTG
jgi:hypothetical protein